MEPAPIASPQSRPRASAAARRALVRAFAHAFRPNVASLGYALFLAVNATSVWGGVFPFLPLAFQTSQILFGFFLAQSLAFALAFFTEALAVYRFPRRARSFTVKLTVAAYMLGWCALIAATYLDPLALPLVVAGGALLGLGSAEFYLLWQRLFASSDGQGGTRDLLVGTALSSVFYFALYAVPVAVAAYLVPLVFLPLFGLAIVLKSRAIDLDQPMFADVPREHPQVYRRAVALVWRSAFCVGALGFCAGVMRSLAIVEASVGSFVNVLSMVATLVAAALALAVWRAKDLRLNVVASYRAVFPFVITAFVVMPFAGLPFVRWFAAALYALYSVAVVLMMLQCAQMARENGINPVFVYGIFGGIVYVLHDVGFIAGSFSEQVGALDLPPLVLAALAAVYMLALMYFVGQGGFRRDLRREGSAGAGEPGLDVRREFEGVELVAPRDAAVLAASALRAGDASSPRRGRARAEDVPSRYRDRVSKQVAVLRQHYGLSTREAEVLELLARGTSVPRIATELVVSENTIRTHTKRIYAKLDVHKKQELLDLVDAFAPSALQG